MLVDIRLLHLLYCVLDLHSVKTWRWLQRHALEPYHLLAINNLLVLLIESIGGDHNLWLHMRLLVVHFHSLLLNWS